MRITNFFQVIGSIETTSSPAGGLISQTETADISRAVDYLNGGESARTWENRTTKRLELSVLAVADVNFSNKVNRLIANIIPASSIIWVIQCSQTTTPAQHHSDELTNIPSPSKMWSCRTDSLAGCNFVYFSAADFLRLWVLSHTDKILLTPRASPSLLLRSCF